jgi:hypothetical protein
MKRPSLLQGKTEFEQKILNWIFRPSLIVTTKSQPPAWLSAIVVGREILVIRIVLLWFSMLLIWILFSIWSDKLSHYRPHFLLDMLLYVIDHPLEVCIPDTPRSILEKVFLKWFAAGISVIYVGLGFILIRVTNQPLEVRLGLGCCIGGAPILASPTHYLTMPCSVKVGVPIIFTLLLSVSAIAFLVCSIRIKKWSPEMWRSVGLPIEESNG